jgi:hypothetical protein
MKIGYIKDNEILNEEKAEEEEDKDDLMSDYVDENFENDETDEFWDT